MNTPKLNSNQSLIFILDIQEKNKHLQTTHWLIMLIFWALFHPFPTFTELFFKARNPGGTDPQPQWPFIAVKVAMDWWNHPSPQHGTRKPLKWSMKRTDDLFSQKRMDLSVEFFFWVLNVQLANLFNILYIYVPLIDKILHQMWKNICIYIYTHIQYINMDGKHALITVL